MGPSASAAGRKKHKTPTTNAGQIGLLKEEKMSYVAKNYERLLGIRGFSDKLLKAHFKLYEGYVAHINKMIDFLNGGNTEAPGYDEAKRRFAWEFNGMRLHEAYFGNMTKQFEKLDSGSDLAHQITAPFGSWILVR